MTDERAINVLLNEKTCVLWQSAGKCDRECGKCDLVLDDEEIVEAYNHAILAIQRKDDVAHELHKIALLMNDFKPILRSLKK